MSNFALYDVIVDGLGRLIDANETTTQIDDSRVDRRYIYDYDMLSQLTDANITNIEGSNWTAQFSYKANGDMLSRTINAATGDTLS